jgi:hypothetical protein
LATSITVAQNRYLRERTQGCPEDRLELLRRFMDSAKDLQTKIQTGGTAGGGGVQMNQQQNNAAGLPPPVQPMTEPGLPGGMDQGTSTVPIAA